MRLLLASLLVFLCSASAIAETGLDTGVSQQRTFRVGVQSVYLAGKSAIFHLGEVSTIEEATALDRVMKAIAKVDLPNSTFEAVIVAHRDNVYFSVYRGFRRKPGGPVDVEARPRMTFGINESPEEVAQSFAAQARLLFVQKKSPPTMEAKK